MRKIIRAVFFLAAFSSFGCEHTNLAENQDAAIGSSSTTAPTPTAARKGRHSKEFDEHYSKGMNIWTHGKIPDDLPQAIEEFKKAAAIDPTNTTSFDWMIRMYTILKDYDGVANSFREIIKRDPKALNAQYGLAQVLVEDLKRYDEGLKEALIAKEKKASYPWAIEETLGKAYEGKGDIPNAIRHYKAYLKDFRDSKDTDSTLYKNMQKKVVELEKILQNSNSN